MNKKGGFSLSIIIAVAILVVGGFVGYSFKPDTDNSELEQENVALQAQVAQLQTQNSDLDQENVDLQTQIEELQNTGLIPIEQIYDLEDENCEEGETGRYGFDGSQINFIDCKPIPSDLGDICSSDDECEYNCITADNDLVSLGCPVVSCQSEQLTCEGIKGRCAPYGVEFKNIYQIDMVNVYCLQ